MFAYPVQNGAVTSDNSFYDANTALTLISALVSFSHCGITQLHVAYRFFLAGLTEDYDIRGQTDCAPFATYYLEKGMMCLARRIVGSHCQDDGDTRGWWWYMRVCAIRLTNVIIPDFLER